MSEQVNESNPGSEEKQVHDSAKKQDTSSSMGWIDKHISKQQNRLFGHMERQSKRVGGHVDNAEERSQES